jgi:hypothetical protein
MEWPEFYQYFRDQVPGCSDPAADRALLHAAQEFFTETCVWNYELDPIALEPGVDGYTLPLPYDQTLVKLMGARIGDKPLQPWLARGHLPERTAPEVSHVYADTPDSFKVWPIPEQPQEVVLRVSVAPSDDASGVPDTYARSYRTALVRGALSYLYDELGAPYYNEKKADRNRIMFRSGIATARVDLNQGFSTAGLRVVSRGFVHGRNWW